MRVGSVIRFVFAFTIATSLPASGADDRSILDVAADGSTPYRSIQAALDAAPANAVVRIAPGRYEGPLNITKPVTLEGAGWAHTKITADWHDLRSMTQFGNGTPVDQKARFDQLVEKLQNTDGDEYARTLGTLIVEFGPKPTLTVSNADGVVLKDLRVSMTGVIRGGGWQSAPMTLLENSKVRIEDCAFAGSPVEGIQIRGACNVDLHECLVAGIRATGIVANPSSGSQVRIVDCDIRHCGYSGVSAKGAGGTVIQECRISNVEYHGIRYNTSAPEIVRNVFTEVNRAGIYADGQTRAVVRNNLFLNCGLWGGSDDVVEENTFVFQGPSPARSQPEQAISLGENSQSTFRRNVIAGHPMGVTFRGAIGNGPTLDGNLFDVTEIPNAVWVPNDPNEVARQKQLAPSARSTPPGHFEKVPLPAGNRSTEIRFRNPGTGDFSLTATNPDEPLLGARGYPALESPWPELPEERDLIDRVAEAEADRRGTYRTGPRKPLEAPVPSLVR